MKRSNQILIAAGFAGLLTIGCEKPEKIYPEKAPLPVSVMTLRESAPSRSRQVAGSVRAWKTEDIGFAVSGRVQWVVEPGLEIEGRTFDSTGKLNSPGTQLAQLDPERYDTAVQSAEAQVRIAELKKDTVQVQITNALPAELNSAKADLDLAQTENERNRRLLAQNAGSQTELDQSQATLKSAEAQIKAIEAKVETSKAELTSSDAAISQANQSLKEAERDLADTKLFSSFRGQVSQVHVVPGSVVPQGEAVATVQMMNPIKVELEISASLSRKLRENDNLPIIVTTMDNQRQTLEGVIYNISASADAATRTFTLTLLASNPKITLQTPKELKGKVVARTKSLWKMDFPLLNKIPDGTYYMPESGIFIDANGSYVWRVTNFKVGEPSRRTLKVKKLRVIPGDTSIPFLGKMLFRTLNIAPDQDFNPSTDLVATEAAVENESNATWEGDVMLLNGGGRWLMRPGDVVEVDLAGEANERGLYVPIEAIHHEVGETFLFVVQKGEANTTVKRIAIKLVSAGDAIVSSLTRIVAKSPDESLNGAQIVVGGVHYLVDGQQVAVSESVGVAE